MFCLQARGEGDCLIAHLLICSPNNTSWLDRMSGYVNTTTPTMLFWYSWLFLQPSQKGRLFKELAYFSLPYRLFMLRCKVGGYAKVHKRCTRSDVMLFLCVGQGGAHLAVRMVIFPPVIFLVRWLRWTYSYFLEQNEAYKATIPHSSTFQRRHHLKYTC